jgi:putative redox protein
VAERESIDLAGTRIEVIKEMVADPKRRIGKLSVRIEFPSQLTSGMKAKLECAARTCPVKESLRPDIETPIEFIYA